MPAAGFAARRGQLRRLSAASSIRSRLASGGLGDRRSRGLGAPLAQKLADDGIECLGVPAKLAHRVRMLSTGHGRKNDEADALSVGIAALNSTGLRSVHIDETAQVLRTLTEYRDDLIRTRTQTANRLHGMLARLVPAGLPKRLTAEAASQLLRSVRPREHSPPHPATDRRRPHRRASPA